MADAGETGVALLDAAEEESLSGGGGCSLWCTGRSIVRRATQGGHCWLLAWGGGEGPSVLPMDFRSH